jgi:hypothetical protein
VPLNSEVTPTTQDEELLPDAGALEPPELDALDEQALKPAKARISDGTARAAVKTRADGRRDGTRNDEDITSSLFSEVVRQPSWC